MTPVNLHISTVTWAVYYSGFYLMQILVAFYTMGGFRPETLMLSNASFPIYIRAFWNAVLKRDQPWHVTGRAGSAESPFNYIRPQVTIFLFLLGTSIAGFWKTSYTDRLSVSVIWNAINTLVLGSFVVGAMREVRRLGRPGLDDDEVAAPSVPAEPARPPVYPGRPPARPAVGGHATRQARPLYGAPSQHPRPAYAAPQRRSVPHA